MSFGHFASGFAEAFGQSMLNKQEQERQDKMAKLQGQLLELQIKAGERVQDAQTQVSDMMAGNQLGEFQVQPDQGLGQFNIQQQPGADGLMQPPQFEQTEGMNLPPEAQGMDPMSIGQMMQDPEGLAALMAAQYVDVGDLIPKAGSPNRDLQLLTAAGIEPSSPEGREAILAKFGGDDDLLTKALLQFQVSSEQDKLNERRRIREKEEKTETQRIRGVQVDARTDIKHTQEMFDLMSKLDGTALAVGNPAGEMLTTGKAGLNALMEATGWEVGKAKQMVADRRRLEKLFADGTLGALDRFAGTGTVSGAKFEALQKATPNATVPSQSNMLLLADRLEQLIAAADIEGIEIGERSDAIQLIESLRGYQPTAGTPVVDGPGTVQEVIDFSKMTVSEIEKLDRAALNPDQRAALKARIAELLSE